MQPLVSIIIPTKNRCDLLRETLASLVGQTYRNWEAIVVDDDSTDGTEDFVKSMASAEGRIRFLPRSRRPSGASTCRNIGVLHAQGEYIIFLDSDDVLAPSCLEHRVKVLGENPKLDFAVFLTQVFHVVPGDNPYLWNKFTNEDDLNRFMRLDMPWQTSGPIWRKRSFAQIGPWDEHALSAQDWEYHIRAIAMGLNYSNINEVDSFWRAERNSSTSMGRLWPTPRRIWNRVHLYRRIAAVLRSKKLLTEQRRRSFAGIYYQHAFVINRDRRTARKIWGFARHEKIIGNLEYLFLIGSDLLVRVADRLNQTVKKRFFPEWRQTRTHVSSGNGCKITEGKS